MVLPACHDPSLRTDAQKCAICLQDQQPRCGFGSLVKRAKTPYSQSVPSVSARARIKELVFDRVPGLLRRGPAQAKRVAITFDDGPDEMTPRYLDLLDELEVPATFFVIGQYAETRQALVREYLRRGHQVASHGYDHTRFPRLSTRELLDQCRRTDEAIGGQLTGTPWVRPPHGELDARSIVALRAKGYIVSLWSLDACDYEDKDPRSIAARCASASAGDVLLFHEGQQHTLDALPLVVEQLRASGHECVTMHDLFAA
jgi:peptidoglycan-N-acetylglucosamine deacetylase